MHPIAIVAIVLVVILVALAAFIFWQRQRTEQLRTRYGTEYDRTVAEMGRRKAETELVHRAHRVQGLEIQRLTAEQRERFTREWRAVQAQFVDDPKGAVTQGDRLVEDVMKVRGYPVADFEQVMADLSVHHARVVENYRDAREIAQRHARGQASTEDLRQAMVLYRELFVDLLEEREQPEQRAADRVVERQVERDGGVLPITDRVDGRRLNDKEVRP